VVAHHAAMVAEHVVIDPVAAKVVAVFVEVHVMTIFANCVADLNPPSPAGVARNLMFANRSLKKSAAPNVPS
jgi:hypothetical protein